MDRVIRVQNALCREFWRRWSRLPIHFATGGLHIRSLFLEDISTGLGRPLPLRPAHIQLANNHWFILAGAGNA
jgi:hypothetical protein